MTAGAIAVERGQWREAEGLALLISEAFHELPQTEWLVADPLVRREVMPGYFRILVDQAMEGGAVYVSADRHAAAVWMHVSPGLTRTLPDYDARLAEATGEHADRFCAFDKALEDRHPKSAPHHHLALLAVRPEYQNRGYGSALLVRYHRFLDREQIPAYLEAATRRSVALYGRHGYVPIGPAINLPDGGPLMWPMWRPPRPQTKSTMDGN